MKQSKKAPEKKAAASKPGKVLKRDPVYISETGNGRNKSLYVCSEVGYVIVGWIV